MTHLKQFFAALGVLMIGTAANAAPVAGFSDVTDNADGTYTFLFDTLPGPDIDGTGMGLIFSGFGLDLTVTGNGGVVRQDVPGDGGLGIYNGAGPTDNLESADGEILNFSLSEVFDLVAITFNGELGKNGHQDDPTGRTGIQGKTIKSEDSVKLLGVNLNQKLKFDIHKTRVKRKLNANLVELP